MPATITPELLRTLAEFKAKRGYAVSLYLDLDPSVAPTQPDVAVRISSLLDRASRQAEELRERLSHEQRVGLKADLERIGHWFDDGFDRDGAHGVAVFAAGLDDFWSAHPLSVSVPEQVRVSNELHLAPLAGVVGDGAGALVGYVGRERAQLYTLQGGKLVELADKSENVPGRHDQGGLSQARYERHIENIVEHHLRRVAESLDACVRELRDVSIVLVGAEETRSEFEALLTHEVKERLIGWTTAERHASASELLAAAEPVLAAWRARRETELIERWRQEAARDGRASAGWQETLEAASDGRVELLLVQQGAGRSAYRCPECGRAQTMNGSCPLDGAPMEEHPDGLDLAVHHTLVHGGGVGVIRARRDLDSVEGIGALLRF